MVYGRFWVQGRSLESSSTGLWLTPFFVDEERQELLTGWWWWWTSKISFTTGGGQQQKLISWLQQCVCWDDVRQWLQLWDWQEEKLVKQGQLQKLNMLLQWIQMTPWIGFDYRLQNGILSIGWFCWRWWNEEDLHADQWWWCNASGFRKSIYGFAAS